MHSRVVLPALVSRTAAAAWIISTQCDLHIADRGRKQESDQLRKRKILVLILSRKSKYYTVYL